MCAEAVGSAGHGSAAQVTRAENIALFRLEMAALLTREARCHKCKKARKLADKGFNTPRQCWAHMDQRFDVALRDVPR